TAGYPAHFAGIWADDAKLVLDRFFRLQAGGDNAAHLFAVVGMDDVDPSLVSYLARAGRKSGLLREQLGDQDGPGLACLEIGEAGGLLHQAEALLAAAQGVLGFLALGDVEVSADGAHEVAALVALHLGVAGQPPRLAVIGADDAEFGLEPFVLAVERFLDRADDPGLVVRVQAIDPALHAYRAVADGKAQLFEEPVRADREAIRIGFEVGQAGRVLNQTQAPLAGAKLFLGQLAVGDVVVRTDAADDLPGVVALDLDVAGDPADFAVVGAADAELGARGVHCLEAAFDFPQAIAIIGMDQPQALLAAADGFVGFVTFVDVARDAQVDFGSVRHPERDRVSLNMTAAAFEADHLIDPDDRLTSDDPAVHVDAVVEVLRRNGDVAFAR